MKGDFKNLQCMYSIMPKIMWYATIYNKKPNYIIEYRYYWELAGTLAGGFLKADHVLRNLKVSENLVPSNSRQVLLIILISCHNESY